LPPAFEISLTNSDPVLPDLRPARVERELVAVDDERRMFLENGRCFAVADTRRLHRDERLTLSGRACATLKELPACE